MDFLVDAGKVAAALVAILGAFGAIGKLRPAKWLFRKLVSEPVAAWLRREHAESLAPLRARVDEVGEALVSHMADEVVLRQVEVEDRKARHDELDLWREGVRERLERGDQRMGRIESKLNEALSKG